jgi:hypothetical protein
VVTREEDWKSLSEHLVAHVAAVLISGFRIPNETPAQLGFLLDIFVTRGVSAGGLAMA